MTQTDVFSKLSGQLTDKTHTRIVLATLSQEGI